jgi:AcrR family transcriptional regulator
MWYMKMQPSDPKTELLEAAVDFFATEGMSDVSLRDTAAALGTSHRMLIYHFGSKEGLLVAVVNEIERRQREELRALEADTGMPPDEQLRATWRALSDPAMWPRERLFFELYGQALQGRAHTTQFLDGIVDDWLDPITEAGMRRGYSERDARANARLGLAVVRGLLLDLLATGDHKGCTDAMEAFIRSY